MREETWRRPGRCGRGVIAAYHSDRWPSVASFVFTSVGRHLASHRNTSNTTTTALAFTPPLLNNLLCPFVTLAFFFFLHSVLVAPPPPLGGQAAGRCGVGRRGRPRGAPHAWVLLDPLTSRLVSLHEL